LLSGLAYLLVIATCLPVLFALLMLPALTVAWLSLPETKFVFGCLFGTMIVAMLVGKILGARWWIRKIASPNMAGE
jgi:protein-S-isoprenylcysteine O-methyltransferase Ste14